MNHPQLFCSKKKEKILTKSYSFDLFFSLTFLLINYFLITHKVSASNLDLFTNCKKIHSTWNYLRTAKKYTLFRFNAWWSETTSTQ